MSQYELKKTKAGRVLYVSMMGSVITGSNLQKDDSIQISDRIYLKTLFENSLLPEELKYLKSGIKWIEKIIIQKIGSDKELIVILDEMNPFYVDFQFEFLHYAIAGFIANELEFKLPEWECGFDDSLKGFVFPDL